MDLRAKIVDARAKMRVILWRDGEKLSDPWASEHKGQQRLREIRTGKYVCRVVFLR